MCSRRTSGTSRFFECIQRFVSAVDRLVGKSVRTLVSKVLGKIWILAGFRF